MREIKFRAWDEQTNTWLCAGHWMLKVAIPSSLVLEDDDKTWSLNDDELVWVQYTGLKDKNGVEIYEGDIVKLQYVSSPLEVNYSTVRASFIMGREHSFMPLSDIEVIGNIYENKELLES